MSSNGLILEGGGMRGVYTAGVLDFFLEHGVSFDSCYAVSAGACHGCSYLSGQQGRALRVTVDYLEDKRYCSIYSLLTTGDIFGADMAYNQIPNYLDPYDYEAFKKRKANFYVVVTNCRTGQPEYVPVEEMVEGLLAVRASSSLPLLSRMVTIKGTEYLDGGIADSIPLRKSQSDGHDKNVVVLTQAVDYRKKPNQLMPFIRIRYRKYPALVRQMERRYQQYNETLDYIGREEKAGRVLVIRPGKPVNIGRLEKDRNKLMVLYREGYEDAKAKHQDLIGFLSPPSPESLAGKEEKGEEV